jgi:hypothetical protein
MLLKEQRVVQKVKRCRIIFESAEMDFGAVVMKPPDQIAEERNRCRSDEAESGEIDCNFRRQSVIGATDNAIGNFGKSGAGPPVPSARLPFRPARLHEQSGLRALDGGSGQA